MELFKAFYPDEERMSAYKIDYKAWYDKGYRGILFDIDNTLVPHGAPATEESVALFKKLHEIGFSTCLVSNNKQYRVSPFAKAMETPYVYKASKPLKSGYNEAMNKIGVTPDKTLFIGDQLFTDIWGAKKLGIYTILTLPIHPKEEIQIVLKRRLEAIVLFFYHRRMR